MRENSGSPRRTAIITGAASGIGRAIAVRLAGDGLDVTVVDLPSAAADLETLVTQLTNAGARCSAVAADVSRAPEVEAAVASHVETYGGLDVMVANAGTAVTAPLLETTDEQWQRTIEVNLRGVFNCYRAAARQMVAQGRGGRLIGAASVASHRGGKWQGAYSASKFAVRGLSQSVAQELGEHGITVNVYSPGVVDTPMWLSIDRAITARTGALWARPWPAWSNRSRLVGWRRPKTSPPSCLSWPRPTPGM